MLRSLDIPTFLATPAAPTATPTGGASGHYTYKIVAILANGGPGGSGESHSAPSNATAVTDGPTTLGASNYETITGTAVPGASHYDVYLTATTSGATLGKVGRCTDITVGVVHNSPTQGDGSTPPSASNSGVGAWIGFSNEIEKTLEVWGTFVATLQLQGAEDQSRAVNIGSTISGAGLTAITENVKYLRMTMTAYTSGTPLSQVKSAHLPAAL